MKNKEKGLKKAQYEIDMSSGPILGKMLLFTLPLMASSILQLLFNAADVIVVGKFAGDNSLAAVGSTTALIGLLTNFFLGLSIGVNVMVARYHGAKDKENVSDTVHTSIATSIVGGVFLGLIGLVGAATFLKWMDSPDQVIGLATIYLRIYFLGMPAVMIYNFGSAIMRAVGDTRRSLYYLLYAGILNVVLNLFFVIALHMGVAGVALATIISQCVSAALVLICLIREESEIRFVFSKMRISSSKLKRILQIGLPAGFQSALFNFSNVMIQSAINSFGAVTVAACSAASNLEGFVYVSMNAFAQATLSFTSQNIGAGKFDRVNRVLKCGLLSVMVTGLVVGNTVSFFGSHLLRLYTDNPLVVAEGLHRLRIIVTLHCFCGMMETVVSTLRGMGYSVMPMIVSLCGACGLRLLWILTFFRTPKFHTTASLYLTYPVTWIITFLIHMICFTIVRRKKKPIWGC